MPTSKLCAVLLLPFCLLFSAHADAQGRLIDHFTPGGERIVVHAARVVDFKSAFRMVFGDCNDPCPMPSDSQGMNFGRAISAALALKLGEIKRTVVVNTACLGECVVFADHARKHVCLGPDASFAFYRTASATPQDPPFSNDILQWGRSKKPESLRSEKLIFPLARSKEDALMMGVDEALKIGIWKLCDSVVVAHAFP